MSYGLNRRGFLLKSGAMITGGILLPKCNQNNRTDGNDTASDESTANPDENPLNDKMMVCGCHHSKFDVNGNVVSGPANAPLEIIPVSRDGNILTIGGQDGIALDFSELANADLMTIGNAMKVTGVPGHNLPVIVIRKSEMEFFAVSSRCTHAGCEIGLPT